MRLPPRKRIGSESKKNSFFSRSLAACARMTQAMRKRQSKIELSGPDFKFEMRAGLPLARRGEIQSIIFRAVLIDSQKTSFEKRDTAIRQAAACFPGSPSGRAKALARDYAAYLATAWLRNNTLERPPEPCSAKRFCLHRVARLTNGRLLCWRTILEALSPVEDGNS